MDTTTTPPTKNQNDTTKNTSETAHTAASPNVSHKETHPSHSHDVKTHKHRIIHSYKELEDKIINNLKRMLQMIDKKHYLASHTLHEEIMHYLKNHYQTLIVHMNDTDQDNTHKK